MWHCAIESNSYILSLGPMKVDYKHKYHFAHLQSKTIEPRISREWKQKLIMKFSIEKQCTAWRYRVPRWNQITHFESRRIVIIARPNVIIISVILSLIIVVTFLNIVFFSLHAFMVTISIDRSIHFSLVFVNFFFSLSFLIAKRKATRFWISIVIIVAVVSWFQILVYFFRYFENLKHLRRC